MARTDPVITLRMNYLAVTNRLAEAEAEIERLRAKVGELELQIEDEREDARCEIREAYDRCDSHR